MKGEDGVVWINVRLPVYVGDDLSRCPDHVDTRFRSADERAAMARLTQGLYHHKVEEGPRRVVGTHAAAIRYLMQAIEEEIQK